MNKVWQYLFRLQIVRLKKLKRSTPAGTVGHHVLTAWTALRMRAAYVMIYVDLHAFQTVSNRQALNCDIQRSYETRSRGMS